MSNKNEILFTAGQFATLHGINKRTLIYYDDIGLFSPAIKKDNGYRYYTYMQSPALEMILAFRELDMSIEEIIEYMKNRSSDTLASLLETKSVEIDNAIGRLKDIKRLLKEKENLLQIEIHKDFDSIEIVDCKEEYLLLSDPIEDTSNGEDVAILIEHAKKFHTHRLFNQTYGSMISVNKLMQNEFTNTDYFFIKVNSPSKKNELFVRPKGKYIRAYCIGDWDENLPKTYKKILKYANECGLILSGYSYEDGINELTIRKMEEYITRIMIKCE